MQDKKIIIYILKILVISTIICIGLGLNNYTLAATRTYDYTQLDNSKYPGFKSAIQSLKNQYGQFNFQIYETGISWNEALVLEFQGHNNAPKNLIEKTNSRAGMWFCPICTEQKFDSGYNCASIDALAYMMDPRNSLTISSIFQFEKLETGFGGTDGIKKAVKGTFIDNSSVVNAIVQASNNNQINGYYLASKIINEQGANGATLSRGQGYKGNYVGLYNLFNIGAYGNGNDAIITNGFKYADSQNPKWTSPELSILGGAGLLKNSYINRKQNTLYFQKFNVVSESGNIFNHQYQQNIMAAEMEGRTLKKYYTNGGELSASHTFIIPVYENMPSSACTRPDANKANSTYYEIAKVNVSSNKALNVYASTSESSIRITRLNNGERVKVLNRSTNAIDGIYWDLIVSEKTGSYGYVARNSKSGENYLALTGEAGTTGNTGNSIVAFQLFNAKYYADKYSDLKSAFGYDENKLRKHWIESGIKEGRQASPVFDVRYYLDHNSDLKSAFGNDYQKAYNHFISNGYAEGRESSTEYCGIDYKNNYSDLRNMNYIQLMEHYIVFGRNEHRQAIGRLISDIESVVFNAKYYADNNPDLKSAFGYNEKSLFNHWLENGIKEGRQASPVFNSSYYLYNNSDLKKAFGMNYKKAYDHFISNGYKEGRSSSKEYCGNYYKNNNSDLKNMNYIELMKHYIAFGKNEGRKATNTLDLTPFDISDYLFDSKTYADLNADLKKAFGYDTNKLKAHWKTCGIKEGRQASLIFNVRYYLDNNSDLKKFFGNDYKRAYEHFISTGVDEGRKGSIVFDVRYYLENNSDLKKAYGNAYRYGIQHFATCGIKEQRITSSTFSVYVYRNNYLDLRNAFGTNYQSYYVHYITSGINEKRKAY